MALLVFSCIHDRECLIIQHNTCICSHTRIQTSSVPLNQAVQLAASAHTQICGPTYDALVNGCKMTQLNDLRYLMAQKRGNKQQTRGRSHSEREVTLPAMQKKWDGEKWKWSTPTNYIWCDSRLKTRSLFLMGYGGKM